MLRRITALWLATSCTPAASDPADPSSTTTEPAGSSTSPEPGTSAAEPDPTTSSSTSSSTDDPTTGAPPPDCAVAGVAGTCIDRAACPPGATAFQALCDGPPALQCCVPAAPPCSVAGAPGLCMSTDTCAAPFTSTPGHCPGDATIQCCTDPTTACDPDAAPRPDDGLSEQPGDPGCPPGMVRSDGFCIDRHEAALLELDAANNIVATWSPYKNPGATPVRAVSLPGAVPQGYISQVQAAAACNAAGKRLCTDAEWLRACRGAADTTYPYGPDLVPGACNDARATHPAVELFGTADPWIYGELDNACLSQLPASLALTDQHPQCISDDGALDMMGNLHEWTADPAGTFRGGFYVDTSLNGPGCTYATTAHDTAYWDYSTGFRCCAD